MNDLTNRLLYEESIRRGYKFEVSEPVAGVQEVRMVRPDGSVAMIARRNLETQSATPHSEGTDGTPETEAKARPGSEETSRTKTTSSSQED